MRKLAFLQNLFFAFMLSGAFPTAASDLEFKGSSAHRTCQAIVTLLGKLQKTKIVDGAKYQTFPMNQKYWFDDWWYKTKYITEQSLENAAIDFDKSRKIWIFAKSKESIPDGTYIFVMDSRGKIYIHEHQYGEMLPSRKAQVHHSSFFNGEELAAGGELKFQSSCPTSGNTRTGHYAGYWPEDRNRPMAYQFLNELYKRNPEAAPTPFHLWGSGIELYSNKNDVDNFFRQLSTVPSSNWKTPGARPLK